MWCFVLLQLHFVKLGSHLRDCNSHDDWLSCHNIIRIFVKPIWSCPLDYTNFILFHNVKLLLLSYVLSPMLVHFFYSFSTNTTLLYLSHSMITCCIFCLFSCINFVLLNNLYWHIYTIMHLMYDTFVLFHVLYFFMNVCMYICILYCSSLDHLKPYACH